MLNGQVVFVKGAAGGIGRRIAEACAENGAVAVISDVAGDKAAAVAAELVGRGFAADSVRCDVTNEDEIRQALDYTTGKYGRLDALVNNAGLQHVAALEDFPTEKFEQMLRIMLTAPFMAIKHALPVMKRQSCGRILNIASINGLVGFAGKAAYNSAKHGLIGLTKVAALECAADGITVNALCPGYTDTPLVRGQLESLARARGVELERVLEEVIYPLVPQKRLLDVQEIADYAVFLISAQAKGVTGQAVVIDGGYTAQ